MKRNVPIAEARKLSRKMGYIIHWRPEPHLPEDKQYATIEEA